MIKLWTGKETQSFIRQLRKAGFQVDKVDAGFYKCLDGDTQVFSAMKGMGGRGYICRLNSDYIQENTQ